MDGLAGILDGPRAKGAFLLRTVMDPPWSMRIEDRAALSAIAVVRGAAWIVPDEREPVRLAAGDVAIAAGTDPYTVADSPRTPPQVVIHPGQRCTTLRGEDLAVAMSLGVRTWGNAEDGATVLLTGTYETAGEIGQRLLATLPPLLVLPHDAWDSPLVALLGQEIVRSEPGQEAVLDRLLDLVVIAALRTWFARPDARPPAWYQAQDDPIVGRALRLLQHNPAHQWTVAGLATNIGVSRATLAKRFTDLVGEPPMTFLTGWRLALAADLLRETDATVETVARQVGYGTPFALSTAFRRVRGVSPQQYRSGVAPAVEEPAGRTATSQVQDRHHLSVSTDHLNSSYGSKS